LTAVRKSQQFEEDYTAAALYLANENPSAGLNFLDAVDAVDAAIELLGAHPEMAPVWRYGAPDNPTRYLLLPGFHSYLIFYRHARGEVVLGRLLHGAQDLREILGE
jgi:plasmid stabilization system protein ParE